MIEAWAGLVTSPPLLTPPLKEEGNSEISAPPPPPSAVPLPRFAGEDPALRPAATVILPCLRGRGTTRSVVEGALRP